MDPLLIAVATVVVVLTALWWRYVRVDGRVEVSDKKHGGQLVASVLQAHGVKYVFTLVGGHISPILVSCEELGIKVVDTRHEVTAVFAADAVARLSGVPGVAAVTAGPGLTNTITAVKNCQMAETPLVLIGGAAGSLLKGRGALQDIDQMSLFKPLCKYCATITRVRDIVPVMRRAFYEASSGTPGPVFVEFPIDVLYPYTMVLREFAGASGVSTGKKPSMQQQFVKWYLMNHLQRQFADAWIPQNTSPIKPDIPLASLQQVAQAVRYLENAKKPVIVLGSQATLPPVPAEKLRDALEGLGIPCYLTGMSRGLLGRKSNISFRQERSEALKEADVIILAGSVCDFRMGYGRKLNRKAKIIAVNRSKSQLMLNADMFWRPSLAIQGDVASFVVELARALPDFKCPQSWLQTLRQRDEDKEAKNLEKGLTTTDFINPIKLHQELEQLMSDNSIIVADGGDFVGTAAYILRPRGPLRWLDPGAFGTLGVGGGFALGAKLCRPDAEVWVVYGDGSVGYSLAEFDTFARHKVPVIALVGNDGCWSQIAREQVPTFNSSVACDLVRCDYHVAAQGYGGEGLVVKDIKDVSAVLRKAQEIAKTKPVLVNAFIGITDFRAGSISV